MKSACPLLQIWLERLFISDESYMALRVDRHIVQLGYSTLSSSLWARLRGQLHRRRILIPIAIVASTLACFILALALVAYGRTQVLHAMNDPVAAPPLQFDGFVFGEEPDDMLYAKPLVSIRYRWRSTQSQIADAKFYFFLWPTIGHVDSHNFHID